MTTAMLPGLVALVHQLGTLILVGCLFLVLAVLLPAIERVSSPRQRMRLRRGVYGRMFLWAWLGLVLLWGTGIAELALTGQSGLPSHIVLMALLSLLFMLLFLFAHLGLHLKAIVAWEDGNSELARYLLHRLRPVLTLAFVIAVVVAVLDVAGPALVPVDLLDQLTAQRTPLG